MPDRGRVPAIIGGTNIQISLQASNERSVNYFREANTGQGKVQRYMRKIEGMRQLTTIGSSDTSALFYQDGRAFAVTGTIFAEWFADGSNIQRGTVGYHGKKATIVSNGSAGHQVVICSAGNVYVYNLETDDFQLVTSFNDAGVNVRMVEFIDGYIFALETDSRRVYYSALEDALTWDFTFGYLERQWGSDNIAFIKRSGRQVWFIGTKTSEVWADNGNATIPFAPIQGAFLDVGCIAWQTGERDGETITWLSQNEQGGGLVVRASGYDPEAVSNYAIATTIQLENTELATCEAFVHQITGHSFYWLYVPGLETTLVYDFTERLWCERAMWNKALGRWEPHVARCHAFAFEKNYVGVRTNGVVYHLSPVYRNNVLITYP